MELGAAAADQALPNPTRTVVNSTLQTGAASATGATATDEDPPF
jgi:recombination associated protein RdgC